MPNYRRAFRPGGTFFFTLVTFRRARFLSGDLARPLLRGAIEQCRAQYPIITDAMVLLPDHLHAMWTLPEGDADFSSRWGRIKKAFTQAWVAAGGWEGAISDSRERNRRRGVWQRRFWEHVIRDEGDYERHMNYIHYNPIKHGYVQCAHAWEWSSFERLVKQNIYEPQWCCGCDGHIVQKPDFEGLNVAGMEAPFGE
jgi:putative transposase